MHIYISMSQYVPSEYHFLIIHFPSLFITLLSYLIKIANIEEKIWEKKNTIYSNSIFFVIYYGFCYFCCVIICYSTHDWFTSSELIKKRLMPLAINIIVLYNHHNSFFLFLLVIIRYLLKNQLSHCFYFVKSLLGVY